MKRWTTISAILVSLFFPLLVRAGEATPPTPDAALRVAAEHSRHHDALICRNLAVVDQHRLHDGATYLVRGSCASGPSAKNATTAKTVLYRVAYQRRPVLGWRLTECARVIEEPSARTAIQDALEIIPQREQMSCRDLSAVDRLISPDRIEFVLEGDCSYVEGSERGLYRGPAWFRLTYLHAPSEDWRLADFRPLEEGEAPAVRRPAAAPDAGLSIGQWALVVAPSLVTLALGLLVMGVARYRAIRGEWGPSPVAEQIDGFWAGVLYRISLGLYAVFASVMVYVVTDQLLVGIATLALIGYLAYTGHRWAWARRVIGIAAGAQSVLFLFGLGSIVDLFAGQIGFGLIALLFWMNFTLPAAVLAFTPLRARPSVPLNLPAGYAYSLTRHRSLSPLQRLLVVAGFTVLAPFVFIGGPAALLVVAVFCMPVLIGVYLAVHMLSGSRDPLPVAARRLRVEPRMQKPAQTRHHWTINTAEYNDRRLYRD